MPDRRQHDPFQEVSLDLPPITTELAYETVKDLLVAYEESIERLPAGETRRHFARYASRLRERIEEYERNL